MITTILEKEMSVDELLTWKLTQQEYVNGMRELFGSAIARTKFLENPKRASHHQLLWLAEKTGISAWELLNDYEVGTDQVTDLERQNLRSIHLFTKD